MGDYSFLLILPQTYVILYVDKVELGMSPLLKAGTIATSITAIVGASALMGIEVPRPAWTDDVKMVQSRVDNIDRRVTEQQLESTELQLYRNLREQRAYEQKSQTVPDLLLKEQTMLESKKRRLERHLRRLP